MMTQEILKRFDSQLSEWRGRLEQDIHLTQRQARKPASCVYEEVRDFPPDIRKCLASSPVLVHQRLKEIEGLICFNATYNHLLPDPCFARAFIIVSNYVSFVYLGDTVYRVLAENFPTDTASYALGRFLRSQDLRDFRHALAHGNWMISHDGNAIEYWPRPDSPSKNVTQGELIFWYTIARATGYAALAGVE